MAKVISEQLRFQPIFFKGKDVLKMRILQRIKSKDKYACWYIEQFIDMTVKSKQTIRKLLMKLEQEGYLKKYKAYPVYWKLREYK